MYVCLNHCETTCIEPALPISSICMIVTKEGGALYYYGMETTSMHWWCMEGV